MHQLFIWPVKIKIYWTVVDSPNKLVIDSTRLCFFRLIIAKKDAKLYNFQFWWWLYLCGCSLPLVLCSVQNAIFSKSLHCLAIDAISINRITNTLYYINVVKRLYYMINSVMCVCVCWAILQWINQNVKYNNRLWPFSFGSNILCTSKYVEWSYILRTLK